MLIARRHFHLAVLYASVMSGLCCSRNSGVKKKTDESDSHKVQVANSEGLKWMISSSNAAVPVQESDKAQFWNLEQNPNDTSQWSFYIVSKGKKLYVTYNDEDASDEKVKLKRASSQSNETRYFKALVQASARVLITSITSNNRIMWIKDGVLAMLQVSDFENKDWYISPSPDSFLQFDIKYRVKMEDPVDSLYWRANDSIPGNTIKLWDNKDVWESIITPTGSSFMPTSDIYASVKADSDVCVLLGTSVTEADLRKFVMSGSSGVKLRSVHNDRYVSINRTLRTPILRLEEDETHAVSWQLTVVGFIFVLEDGTKIYFPPLRKTREKHAKATELPEAEMEHDVCTP